MPRLQIGQLGFSDAAVAERDRGRIDALFEVSRLVNWDRLAVLFRDVHAARRGEASFPPLAMFKVLLLQKWHCLSDPAMEAALADRLSFLRFAGFSLDDRTPDHTTIWRFREALGTLGLIERAMAELDAQLSMAGLKMKSGTIVDASLVTSAARRPKMNEPKDSPVDPQASFGRSSERGNYSFGYKAHVAVDAATSLVRRVIVTPAHVQEVSVLPGLLDKAAGTLYADRGYDSGAARAMAAGRGLGDGLMLRRRGSTPLTHAQQKRNDGISAIRRRVEKVFGTMKRSYRMGRMRACTMLRNTTDITLFAIAYNLRRWRAITLAG